MARQFPTALLRHTTTEGVHYDWLLADPNHPAGRLWTARTDMPSRTWSKLSHWLLEPIGAHRRIYLTYQGPVAGNRGEVVRVDEGVFHAEIWRPTYIVINLSMRRARGRIQLSEISEQVWRATWL